MTRRLSLLHQIVKSRQAETTHINLAFVVDDLLRKRLRFLLSVVTFLANSGLDPFCLDFRS